MPASGHVHQSEVFCWTGWSLQALHKRLCLAAPLYDLTSGDNKDKKLEHIDLSPEALEAFDRLKAACLQAPILAFPDFNRPFLLETDASREGLGAVLSQKQVDGRYHPIAYASHVMNETEQRYHSNKQEFLALKWVVTEQFHEYLLPYGKNRNAHVHLLICQSGCCRAVLGSSPH